MDRLAARGWHNAVSPRWGLEKLHTRRFLGLTPHALRFRPTSGATKPISASTQSTTQCSSATQQVSQGFGRDEPAILILCSPRGWLLLTDAFS
jgi:hypothetical protein